MPGENFCVVLEGFHTLHVFLLSLPKMNHIADFIICFSSAQDAVPSTEPGGGSEYQHISMSAPL